MADIKRLEQELSEILKSYKPISLHEMDSVELLSRTDTKYFFQVEMLKEILTKTKNYYHVLDIKSHRQFQYYTTYFDTPEYLFYYNHQHGKLNRYKVRQRRYDLSGTEFFEVKFKTNKGWTQKSRILNMENEYLNKSTNTFLKQCTPYSNSQLQKSIKNDFIRITLVNNQLNERATLDFNISFSDSTHTVDFPNLGIIEVKQDSFSRNPMIMQILKELKIRPNGISKYCLGVGSLCKCVKTNMIKHNIYKINNSLV